MFTEHVRSSTRAPLPARDERGEGRGGGSPNLTRRCSLLSPALSSLREGEGEENSTTLNAYPIRWERENRRQLAAISEAVGTFRRRAVLLVGKGVALPPLPPRCRDRVHSLYLPACRFPTPGDPRWRRLSRVGSSDFGQSEPPRGSSSAVL